MKRQLTIGLTGGIASGKTTVANYLAKQGAYLIDTDIIAREVVAPNQPTTRGIQKLLGADSLFPDGNLDRARIKQVIFNDECIKSQYEAIIMPAIRRATLDALSSVPESASYAVLIVPLLFEKGLDKHCDYTISVDIPVAEQIRRGVSRKASDDSVIRKIIAAQMDRETRNQHADFVVNNDVSLEKLYPQLDILHQQLIALAVK